MARDLAQNTPRIWGRARKVGDSTRVDSSRHDLSAYNKYDKDMKVPCEKKKKRAQQWVPTKPYCERKSYTLPHTQPVTEERVRRFLIYCISNFGICIEISLLINFIVKKQKATIHRKAEGIENEIDAIKKLDISRYKSRNKEK